MAGSHDDKKKNDTFVVTFKLKILKIEVTSILFQMDAGHG